MPGTPRSGRTLTERPRLVLVASADDLLLENAFKAAVEDAADGMGDPSIETLNEAISPEDVAVELNSPSLFNPERVLLIPDASPWVIASAAPGGPKLPSRQKLKSLEEALRPLASTLEAGLADSVALVMGVWCGSKPGGPLVDAVQEAGGRITWIGLPEPPKPWEDTAVSEAQKTVLRGLIAPILQDIRIAPKAEGLLFERLGFAPRQLVQEVRKLVVTCGSDTTIDLDLVRRHVLPREGSLEVLQDACLTRDPRLAVRFLEDARRGLPIRDWSGQTIEERSLGIRAFNLVFDALTRMLYLQGAARQAGAEKDLDPQVNAARGWYARSFKTRVGPALVRQIEGDEATPFRSRTKSGSKPKAPSLWALQKLFRGASLYPEQSLVRSLAEGAAVERHLRRPNSMDALPGWLLAALGADDRPLGNRSRSQ